MAPAVSAGAEAPSERSWRAIYMLGAVVAFVAVAALLFDIVLSMMPGWGTASVPTDVAGWFAQFAGNPWLGMRNLDLLNVTVSLVSVPFYLAISAALRKSEPGFAFLGFAFFFAGTVLFAAANAALPMLQLSREYAGATGVEQVALESAAAGLLARGAHGSAGAFAGFFLSELGTFIAAYGMWRSGVFARHVGLLGMVGSFALGVYSVLVTFASIPADMVVALAAPGGLLMIAWQVLVARRLFRLRTNTG